MTTTREHATNVRNRLARHRERRIGAIKRKILLLLLGGVTVGLSGSPSTTWKIVGALRKEWKTINKQTAERGVNTLFASNLVAVQEEKDGALTLILNERGRKRALTYNIGRLKIEQPSKWDELWRVVSFDIPEDEKAKRDTLREHLLNAGFYELHNSVLVFPFDCRRELEFLAELYDVSKYLRFILATHISNEIELKEFFKLS